MDEVRSLIRSIFSHLIFSLHGWEEREREKERERGENMAKISYCTEDHFSILPVEEKRNSYEDSVSVFIGAKPDG